MTKRPKPHEKKGFLKILRNLSRKRGFQTRQCRITCYNTRVDATNTKNRNETMPNMTPIISLRIIALQQNGMTLPEAFDAVLGAGSYDRMVTELYEELRK